MNCGIYELDRHREEARSGVPSWWRPYESRRKRCQSWAETARASKKTWTLTISNPYNGREWALINWPSEEPASLPPLPSPRSNNFGAIQTPKLDRYLARIDAYTARLPLPRRVLRFPQQR